MHPALGTVAAELREHAGRRRGAGFDTVSWLVGLARDVPVLREGAALECVDRELLSDPDGFSRLMDEMS